MIALSRWFPDRFHDLAAILNWIEEHGVWPNSIVQSLRISNTQIWDVKYTKPLGVHPHIRPELYL